MPELSPEIHRSVYSSKFQDLAKRYFDYWQDDTIHLDPDEHKDIRKALIKTLKYIPTDGVIAFCGTGPRIARYRDLDSSIVGGHLEDHEDLLLSDFSQNMVISSFRTIADESASVAARTHLVIRDFSDNNLSARFDVLMRERIARIKNLKQMNAFVEWIRNEIGLAEVQKQKLPKDYGRIDPRLAAKPDEQEGLQFDKIVRKPVRLIVANLLISGMFAVTEMDFRSKLYELHKRYPKQMTKEKLIECLTVWHELLLPLNEKVGKDFRDNALHANDEIERDSPPTVFLSVDDTVTYTGLQGFDRIRMNTLSEDLPEHISMREVDKAHWNHAHEEIPHKHSISVIVFSSK